MKTSQITKVEISKHLWLPIFTSFVYINNNKDYCVRFDTVSGRDDIKVSMFNSTMESRIAGVDHLIAKIQNDPLKALSELEKPQENIEKQSP